jgi:hypothetical protein
MNPRRDAASRARANLARLVRTSKQSEALRSTYTADNVEAYIAQLERENAAMRALLPERLRPAEVA